MKPIKPKYLLGMLFGTLSILKEDASEDDLYRFQTLGSDESFRLSEIEVIGYFTLEDLLKLVKKED